MMLAIMTTVMMPIMTRMMSRRSDEARQGAGAGLAPPRLSARPQVTIINSSSSSSFNDHHDHYFDHYHHFDHDHDNVDDNEEGAG